ncbi:inositol monophosphatase family protein [Psychromonas sp. MME2]|uniref:inositol monophosphatase family protein n=1 Tax=unclassified Psychromonas TaxID=2614957 RepID=UPI00339BB554
MWNAKVVYQTSCELADIAIAQQNKLVTEIKPDNSIVTQADKMVEQRAIELLAKPDKKIFVIGEETVKELSQQALDAALKGNSYLIDPIDGTVPYTSLTPVWGISIGYAEQGKIVEGCIVLPGTFEVILTDNGVTYYGKGGDKLPDFDSLQPLSLQLKENCTTPSRVLAISQHTAKNRNVAKLKRGVGCYFSVVFPFVYLALGRMAGIYASLNVWDSGAGFAILKNLGFHLAFEDGQAVTFDVTKDFDFSTYKEGKIMSRQAMIMSPSKAFSDELLATIE